MTVATSGISWNISSKEIPLQNEAWMIGKWETNEARGTENTQVKINLTSGFLHSDPFM